MERVYLLALVLPFLSTTNRPAPSRSRFCFGDAQNQGDPQGHAKRSFFNAPDTLPQVKLK
jgi:hypothetical protein